MLWLANSLTADE